MPILMKLGYAQGMDPRALIVVPTRELVVQVCETIELLTPYLNIRALALYAHSILICDLGNHTSSSINRAFSVSL